MIQAKIRDTKMKNLHLVILLVCALLLPLSVNASTDFKASVESMKEAERGPFSRIRWFCKDGTILPPKSYACGPHGGGVQHGQWSEQTEELRDNGYYIANTLAGIDRDKAKALLKDKNFIEMYNQILLEKFLIAVDDGWIFRQAQFYRGAVQEEDERKGARALLLAMLADKQWYMQRYAATRIGVRMLAHGQDTASVQKVRQLAASLSDRDSGFKDLRVKIHGAPDAGDASLVRDYATAKGKPDLQAQYKALAGEIDQVYAAKPLDELLNSTADGFTKAPWLQKILRDYATDYSGSDNPENHYLVTAYLLEEIRDNLDKIHSPGARLTIMDVSLAVEAENFRAATALGKLEAKASRNQRLYWLSAALGAAYGTGQINPRLRAEAEKYFADPTAKSIPLSEYLEKLNYLAKAPAWASQGLRYQFFEAMQKLAEIEPLANHFIQDQLRGSPLLMYSRILNSLSQDANRLAGVKHKVFNEEIGTGFHALNPGLTRGTLYTQANLEDFKNFDTKGIYLLPETISDLPPLAGIITAGEGNPLSHVQLLARNLGIPNVSIDETMLPRLRKLEGQVVVLAVSPNGLVEISPDSKKWQKFFEENQTQNVVIRPDLEKLDLSVREFIDLNDLRASDSGRIVGPKAAKLGELRSHFPDMVSPGVGIPFGVFRQTVLEKPYRDNGRSVYDWMLSEYDKISKLPADSEQHKDTAERFRAELYQLILDAPLDKNFQAGLRTAMEKAFGKLDNIGVFVRSDTNVEDLPGFTGAGLNLTLPNVTGFDNVVKAINKVWASPFTQRAFAWRQSHMDQPQYVYPAVLLLQSVPNDKSGVMVTEDINTGDRNIISVAVNEGVGGAVDGQSAESLRINMSTGAVKVLATATAPWKRLPVAGGGIEKTRTSGDWTTLQAGEIKQMIDFAKELPKRFPAITDDDGSPAPADVEFGFLDGKMHLFQLRPFLQSKQAQGNSYLMQMDKALDGQMDKIVELEGVPR